MQDYQQTQKASQKNPQQMLSDEQILYKQSLLQQKQNSKLDITTEEIAQPKSLLERWFSPLKQGSLRGSIFAFLASALGTGVFNLPLRASVMGIIFFSIEVIIGAVFSWIGMWFILALIQKYKFKSYVEMSTSAYGIVLKRLSQLCIIIYPWGITICFQVILARFFCQLLDHFFNIKMFDVNKKEFTEIGNLWRIGCNIVCLLFALILAMKKQVSILQTIGLIGVVNVVFNIFAVIITSFTGFTRNQSVVYHGIFHLGDTVQKINWFKNEGLDTFFYLTKGMAAILFCYVNHQMVFPLSGSLKNPTQKRFQKIINRVHLFQLMSYYTIGITAYLLLLEHKQQYQIQSIVIASIPTLPLTIGKILMLVSLFLAIPLNMFPARQSFFEAFNIERSKKNHIVVTLLMMCSSTIIAICFQKVDNYFGLLGGTAGVLMAGGIPGICYYKLKDHLNKIDKVLLTICAVVTVVAVFGALSSFFDAIKSL